MSHSSEDRKELKLVERDIKELEARRYELLDKQELTKREEQELKDFPEKLKRLEAKEKYWQDRIPPGIL
jgi:hypothetical protein